MVTASPRGGVESNRHANCWSAGSRARLKGVSWRARWEVAKPQTHRGHWCTACKAIHGRHHVVGGEKPSALVPASKRSMRDPRATREAQGRAADVDAADVGVPGNGVHSGFGHAKQHAPNGEKCVIARPVPSHLGAAFLPRNPPARSAARTPNSAKIPTRTECYDARPLTPSRRLRP